MEFDQFVSMWWFEKEFKEERKKKKTHIRLKVDKNGLISSLKDQYSSFNINDFKRFKCGIKLDFFFSWPKERTMRLQQGKYVMHFQMNFKIRNNK